MALVPKTLDGKIQFNEARLPEWSTNAVAIGSSSAEVTALAAKTAAARAALTDQQAALATAKSKTAALAAAVDAMSVATSDLVKKVRVKAATGGPAVYQLANIPAPAFPGPVGAPGTPTDFAVELFQDGSLQLKWKCKQPRGASGTIYQVYRRSSPAGEFAYLGGAGTKKFVDRTVPAGATGLTYQVQAVRSTAVGPWAQFNVTFGATAGGGGAVAVAATAATPKLAA